MRIRRYVIIFRLINILIIKEKSYLEIRESDII